MTELDRKIGMDYVENESMGVTRVKTNILRACDGFNKMWPTTKIIGAGLEAWVCTSLESGVCCINGKSCHLVNSKLRVFATSDEALTDIVNRFRKISGNGINLLGD